MATAAWARLLIAGCALSGAHGFLWGQRQVVAARDFVQAETSAGSSPRLSRNEYVAQIGVLEKLAEACKARADACVLRDEYLEPQVGLADRTIEVRREWLSNAFDDAKKAKDAERGALMTKVSERLAQDEAEVMGVAANVSSGQAARSKANEILARREFRSVEQQSAWQRALAALGFYLDRFFNALGKHLPHAPWLVGFTEWGLLGLAAAGLLIWAWRTTNQQRLAVAAPSSERDLTWQKESDDWARKAEAEAARGEWREAVHCLYWAAITVLEGKRMWRANRARTPREYLPLLEEGSARRRALTGLTRILERIWYGLRPAGRSDFEQAQTLLEELMAA